MNSVDAAGDIWSRFVLDRQFGGDAGYKARLEANLAEVRDRILDAAGIQPGSTFLDVGCGQGLLGFGAIARVGSSLTTIFSDISAPLLDYCRKTAESRGILAQCRFVLASANRLESIDDGSVDVAATRASLAWVHDKPAAFAELHRVLKPGGRLSIAEPIVQDESFDILGLARMLRADPNRPDAAYFRLLHRYRSAQYPATDADIRAAPYTSFSERDLLHLARMAGFSRVHLELHIDHRPNVPIPWEVFLDLSPYPHSPTLREIFRQQQFTPQEQALLESGLRPLIESETSVTGGPVAYLTAVKESK